MRLKRVLGFYFQRQQMPGFKFSQPGGLYAQFGNAIIAGGPGTAVRIKQFTGVAKACFGKVRQAFFLVRQPVARQGPHVGAFADIVAYLQAGG